MKKGDLLELEIEQYAYEGKGIARLKKKSSVSESGGGEDNNAFVIFVNGAYPGDKIIARLIKIKKNYAEARTEKILSSSRFRITARCKYFGTCGGCKQQDLDYSSQIFFKQRQVEEIFLKMGGLKDFMSEDIIPSPKIFFYRNKMEFSFSDKKWLTEAEISSGKEFDKDFSLGLHIPNIYDKVLDIHECFLQSELCNKIINFTREFFKERNTPIYNTKKSEGYLRNLVIRQSEHSSDLMVNLVTFYDDDNLMKEYTRAVLNEVPQITTIINNINLKKAAVAAGDYEKVFYGTGLIYDSIGEYKFRISANSFFQTNTLQAENLYRTALEFAELKGDESVYDLYSGAGTIAIFISKFAENIFGFETAESAVYDAEENIKINNVKNVQFFRTDLYNSFLPILQVNNLPLPDAVILDPPRNGMHKNTVEDVIRLNPRKIVYISCNPATQVRDLKMFVEGGYRLIKIRPVDMFPHTYHIENAALLCRG
jgi:23S rRNA (uracil1939-C5)-methyltransferase